MIEIEYTLPGKPTRFRPFYNNRAAKAFIAKVLKLFPDAKITIYS